LVNNALYAFFQIVCHLINSNDNCNFYHITSVIKSYYFGIYLNINNYFFGQSEGSNGAMHVNHRCA
ncbi:MAG: hypothetical protein MR434_09095, partial [Ruminococcus sp.]|nr:hypothetical protein [Ruminococcus sp.]